MVNHFWQNKKVLVTGHTGFKGGWLSLMLKQLGAEIFGYALKPSTQPNFFDSAKLEGDFAASEIDNILNTEKLDAFFKDNCPEIVFHLAAQPLVRESYRLPHETYMTNVIGTLNVLEAARKTDSVRTVIIITTDKCYENKEWIWAYRENDPLGGHDLYSSSKACAEILTASYRASFCSSSESNNMKIATARAGNVIGGGDWSKDRIIPDLVSNTLNKTTSIIRNPGAIRPWQHVLDCLSGYLTLAETLDQNDNPEYATAWNFGPPQSDAKTVDWITKTFQNMWGKDMTWQVQKTDQDKKLHEANFLKLDCTKARNYLNWQPCWDINKALQKTVDWYKACASKQNIRDISIEQISEYQKNQQTMKKENSSND